MLKLEISLYFLYVYIYTVYPSYVKAIPKSRNLRLPSIGAHLAQPLSGTPWIHEVPISILCQHHMTRLFPPLWLWQTGYNLFSKFFVSSALCSFFPIFHVLKYQHPSKLESATRKPSLKKVRGKVSTDLSRAQSFAPAFSCTTCAQKSCPNHQNG